MSPYIHTALVLLCIYLPYKFGTYVGAVAGFSEGFDKGVKIGVDTLMHQLREYYDLNVTHSITIKEKNKNGETI